LQRGKAAANAGCVTRNEKFLVHQIHPLKLAADITAAGASLALHLLWQHYHFRGLLAHFAPPPLAALSIGFADLALRAFASRRIPRSPHLLWCAGDRLFGDLASVVAAWFHAPYAAELAIIRGAHGAMDFLPAPGRSDAQMRQPAAATMAFLMRA
jgi:hypothetical protein